MAASQVPISVKQRFDKNMYVSLSTRCHRLMVNGLAEYSDKTITMEMFYSYDTTISYPLWKKLENSTATAYVKNGRAEFFLVFGAIPDQMRTPSTANILLPRPSLVVKEHELPAISYILSTTEGELLYNDRIVLHKSWEEAIFQEAAALSQSMTIPTIPEFLSTRRVLEYFQESWNQMFSCTKHGKKECEESPKLSFDATALLRIIRAAWPDTDAPVTLPSVIPQGLMRGVAPKEGTSVFRIFHIFAELIGRSSLVERMYLENKIALIGSQDTLVFELSAAELPPYVFFFRLPRSATHEAALVMEIYHKEGETVVPLRPTPYITVSQLDSAGGDPLRAFAKLDSSAHKDILKELTYDSMLTVRFSSDNALQVLPPTLFSINQTDNYCNLYWWESRYQLRECNQ